MQRRLPGVEMTEVEVHMTTYSRRQVAHRQYKNSIRTVVEVAPGIKLVRAMHKRHF